MVEHYFQRFGFWDRQIHVPPRPDISLILVIPCYNEPDLNLCLNSLWNCQRPGGSVEVIVVINSSSRTSPEIRAQNLATEKVAAQWIQTHQTDPKFRVHLLHHPDLPPKHAGVGLARKIGMDEALRRFHDIGRPEGVMVCFDADCQCDPNYLIELEAHFLRHPETPGCSIRFEHPLEGPMDPSIYEAVAAYELHLRYYVWAQRWAGFPFAYQTVGSAMAVRADAYRKQGGMNKRQAGEDFYFLNKIIPLGNFTELNTTRVLPSPRPSDRVPFGTGKAVRAYLDHQESNQSHSALGIRQLAFALRPGQTYPFQAFRDLKQFLARAPSFYAQTSSETASAVSALPGALRSYVEPLGIASAVEEMRKHTASAEAFAKRFFRWFDAFQIMKYVHHARDQHYGTQEIGEAAVELLRELDGKMGAGGVKRLLGQFRALRSRNGIGW